MTRYGVRGLGRHVAVGASVVLAALLQLGCNASSSNAQSAANAPTKRDTRIVHENCPIDSSGAEKIDANGDGRPEIIIVSRGGREQCRAVDLNFDGKFDVWVYRDGAGQVRRRETDYDRDGRIDEIAIYKGGVIVEKQRATTLANKLDTWQFYQGGTLARTERDSNGDAVIDQWWEWPRPGCPLVHTDIDGDGRPDPGATLDYCKGTGYVPPERGGQKAPSGPTFERPGSTVPTELESKEQPGAANSAAQPSGKQSTTAPAAEKAPSKGPTAEKAPTAEKPPSTPPKTETKTETKSEKGKP